MRIGKGYSNITEKSKRKEFIGQIQAISSNYSLLLTKQPLSCNFSE